jgi:hypothetical protein
MTNEFTRRTLWRIGLLILSLMLTGCTRHRDLAALLPQSASGWTRISDVRTFEASDLWRYVDGAADKYLAAGVQRTVTTDYRYQDRFDAVADIHQFTSPEGARGLMDSESSEGSQPAQIGDAARLFGQTLVFRRGPCLVRLVAYQDTPETRAALASLAQAIAVRM